MGKSSQNSNQGNQIKTGPKAFGPGLSDPGAMLQISAGGVPQPGGDPGFADASFAGQLGMLSPQLMQQILASQEEKAPPQTTQAPAETPTSFIDYLRQMAQGHVRKELGLYDNGGA